jgi:tetratricopeptide (TPR) repeat protein
LNTLKALYKREQFKNECLGIKRRLATSLKLFKQMKHSIVCNAVFSKRCHIIGDVVLSAAACAAGSGNKFRYKAYKEYIPYELLGLQTGDVTRWLHLATYFYSQNQFSFSLEIVDHVLAQCTPDKLYYDEDKFIHEHVQGIVYEELYQLKTIANIAYKRNVIKAIVFSSSVTIPHELKTEIDFKGHSVKPPVVYGHFLSFLCYFKQNDYRNCQIALSSLKLTIEGNYFIGNNTVLADSYICLGVAYRMLGLLEDARKCFLTSIRLHKQQDAYGNFMLQSCNNNS